MLSCCTVRAPLPRKSSISETPSTCPETIFVGRATMIQLIHVSKQYDQRLALSDVTFEIGKGEFVLLMGPSGAGKSTVLRMLIGAERPDEGPIFVHQKNVTALKSSDVPYLRRTVGPVFQDFRLLTQKSVF